MYESQITQVLLDKSFLIKMYETLLRNQTLYYFDQHVLVIKAYFHIIKSTLKISGLHCSNSQVFFFCLNFPLYLFHFLNQA